jgi:signal transduction histidine kinase/DNA-binding response OmpR family regulator
MLNVLFQSNGFTVETASNGKEALEILKSKPVDLIITDILMPVMDGFSLCRSCKHSDDLKDIPLIFYTATYTDPKDEAFALSLGASAFLTKPMDPGDLLNVVKNVLSTSGSKETLSTESELPTEEDYYREYSETLIRKLEQKVTQLEQAKNRLSIYYQVSCNLVLFSSETEIVHYFISSLIQTGAYKQVAYYSYLTAGEEFTLAESVGFPDSSKFEGKFVEAVNSELLTFKKGSKNPKVFAEMQTDQKWSELNPQVQSMMLVPLIYRERLLGVLAFFSNEVEAFLEEDVHNVQILANCLAISIENRKYEENVRQMNADLEKKVDSRTQQLTDANKELEAFTYSVSHDLRAPIRGIEGWSQILETESETQLDDQAKESIHFIRSETRRMNDMIEHLLHLSRITRAELKKESVDLSKLANDAVARLAHENPRDTMKVTIEPDLETVGDPVLLDVLLTNLFSNAWKFTSKIENPTIQFGRMNGSDDENYYIRDNGIGFDIEKARNLFGVFQRYHRESDFPGTGVGLATVQRIVNKHGGRIWAESKPGQGATFYFTLGEE